MNEVVKKQTMTKRAFAKNTQYDWLIRHISESIKKSLDGAMKKIMNLFKTNTTAAYYKPALVSNVSRCRKELRKPKIHKEKIKNNQKTTQLKI